MANNNNKFYILQILETKASPKKYYVFYRWGRVGRKGSQKLIPFGTDMAAAMGEFEDKLEDKTVNGSYIELDLAFDEENELKNKQNMEEAGATSSLDPRVNELIKLLFDIKIMKSTMQSIGYDAEKMPLGKLSLQAIENGYGILKDLNEELKKTKPKRHIVEELSSMFYTQIPHDIGFKSMRNMLIKTEEMVKEKSDFLGILSNMKITRNIVDGQDTTKNVIEANYESLKNRIEPVERNTSTYKMIEEYIKNGKCPGHSYYELELLDVFSLERESEAEKFKSEMPNKMLLWHGSRLTNFVGLLSQGIKIAPPEAPVTGYMFGKGAYFTDMVTKSANHCHHSMSNDIGFLILAEVALGETNDLLHADYNASNLPEGKQSTKGCGSFGPKESNF